MCKKVLLGMSGGVDSSVSALLLKNQGYDVTGITLELFNGKCCGDEAIIRTKEVCKAIGIDHVVLDYKNEFKNKIINYFIDEYLNGRTPNPCVPCNKFFKFGYMYEKAKSLGSQYIATGHYARKEFSKKYNQEVIRKSVNLKKDQSYFLYNIDKNILPFVLFPLGNFEDKEDVREIARKNNLVVANQRDSEDICFVVNGDYKKFLQENSDIKNLSGNIIDKNGKILGKHNGIYEYTVGQRKGLNISYIEPLYVIELDSKKRNVIVGTIDDLYKKEIIVKDVNWLVDYDLIEKEINVKTRYSKNEVKATIEKLDNDKCKIIFNEKSLNISKGQSAVFYDNEGIVLGGGIIE